jgi:hypothetical protein
MDECRTRFRESDPANIRGDDRDDSLAFIDSYRGLEWLARRGSTASFGLWGRDECGQFGHWFFSDRSLAGCCTLGLAGRIPRIQISAGTRASLLGGTGSHPRDDDLDGPKLGHRLRRASTDSGAALPAIDCVGVVGKWSWISAPGERHASRDLIVASAVWLACRPQARTNLSRPLCADLPGLRRWCLDWAYLIDSCPPHTVGPSTWLRVER